MTWARSSLSIIIIQQLSGLMLSTILLKLLQPLVRVVFPRTWTASCPLVIGESLGLWWVDGFPGFGSAWAVVPWARSVVLFAGSSPCAFHRVSCFGSGFPFISPRSGIRSLCRVVGVWVFPNCLTDVELIGIPQESRSFVVGAGAWSSLLSILDTRGLLERVIDLLLGVWFAVLSIIPRTRNSIVVVNVSGGIDRISDLLVALNILPDWRIFPWPRKTVLILFLPLLPH